ncbi:hypothetical protein SDC9_124595 [bioreactor metagenome]|uniref:Uncharacterized protein n=1 Tax=bioreactor metagenome TaxID=1076179 RepID=A0A645CKY8_9ZZZZ
MVHGTHFQADNTAAHNQQALRNSFQFQRVSGVPHARIFVRNERQFDRTGTRRDDRVVEVDHGFTVLTFHFQGVRPGEFTQTGNHFHFTAFRHASQTAGQLSDYFFFPGTNLVDIGFRLAEDDTVFCQRFGLFDNFGYVQQCLRRDTADVQTNTAEGAVTFYDDGLQT